MLIAFRVLQGLVAGPMIPLSQTLLLASYPPAKGGTAMAMWAMTVLVAPVAGPLLGGWITDNISWPWIFYINIPVRAVRRGADLVDLSTSRPGAAACSAGRGGLGAAGRIRRLDADHDRQGQGAGLVRVVADSSRWRWWRP